MLRICSNIRLARISAGKKQSEMVSVLGLKNVSTYQNWENETEPSLEIIKKLAFVFGIPAYRLLEGVIDFTEEVKPAPEEEISIKLKSSDVRRVVANLDELGLVFSAFGQKAGIVHYEEVPLVGSKKLRQSKVEKGRQVGTSKHKGK